MKLATPLGFVKACVGVRTPTTFLGWMSFIGSTAKNLASFLNAHNMRMPCFQINEQTFQSHMIQLKESHRIDITNVKPISLFCVEHSQVSSASKVPAK